MAELKENKSKINLSDIHSSNIIKVICSFLDEKQKLNMIIYNKEIQKMLLVDIEDYKKICKKYKIGEKNGKGREYKLNTNTIIFEGEYLNGTKNGKGKEYYDNNELKFEGEYLNGERNGKGKEYYHNGRLKFEGEYLNGKIWNGKGYKIYGNIVYEIINGKGYIKEYNYYNGDLEFEGEYLNGERNGKGKEYNNNGKLGFEGEYLNGKRNGKGKEYYSNGKLGFEGEILNGKIWNGKGYNNNGNLAYEIKNGKGYIKEYFDDKLIFVGE